MKLVSRLVISSRPISWVNTAFPFAVAYYLGTGNIDVTLIVGAFFFLIPYNLLMYGVNDVFDYESDLTNPRKGGLEGALLEPKYHAATLWISTSLAAPFVIYLLAVGSVFSGALLLLVIFSVVAYSAKHLRFKEIPVLDSFTSALHFIGPMLFGLALAETSLMGEVVIMATIAFFLWGMASHAFGAVQDIRADKDANIASIATFFGAGLTVKLAFGSYLLAALMLLGLPGRFQFAAIAALPYLFVTAREFGITDETCETANRGWKRFIWLNFFAGAIISSLLIGPS
ncbi:MAG TPA: prenyltransferase [Candidatus Aquiluna sp.]|uniref:prenyltransferase n=1 Tax=Aquiluna sp. TaxID=2053504 RepID=UPI000ED0E93E|nr:prenyltransferase [Aquiluna sp.]